MSLQEYFGDWTNIVDVKEADRIIRQLSASRLLICPERKDVFKAFRLCPLKELRVVIIGQDPYNTLSNGKPIATGLAFANKSETLEKNYAPSLKILRDSVIDFSLPHKTTIFDPSLEKWEEQGVLLLNSALTCLPGKPGSHSLMWRPFIRSLLEKLSIVRPGIVYVLLGESAQSFKPYISCGNNHLWEDRHPAYYARNHTEMSPDVWRWINRILISQNGYGIEWYKEVD